MDKVRSGEIWTRAMKVPFPLPLPFRQRRMLLAAAPMINSDADGSPPVELAGEGGGGVAEVHKRYNLQLGSSSSGVITRPLDLESEGDLGSEGDLESEGDESST